jgi:hypothetical protein
MKQFTKSSLLALAAVSTAALCSFAQPALAQVVETPPLIDAPKLGAAPKTYALVSAVGSQMQVVRQKTGVGSNMDPFFRTQINMPDQALNNSVLRGLDRSVGRIDPSANRVLLHASIPALDRIPQHRRAQAAADALMDQIKAMPQRQQWDEIIAVTPRYMQASSDRMGTKLWGIGVYVQPLSSGRNMAAGLEDTELMGFEEDVNTVGADMVSSGTFVAPYAYLRFTVLDAKTMKVLRTQDRTDFRKTFDKDCTDRDLFKCFDPDQYGQMIDTLAERTAARGVAGVTNADRKGSVEVRDTKVVPNAGPASAPTR